MKEAAEAVPGPAVLGLIMVDGMLKGVADHTPGQECKNSGGSEPCVGTGGFRFGVLLLGGALEFDGCP